MAKTYRELIKNEADRLGCDVSELLAMSENRDPFFTGSSGDLQKAEWFKEIYEAYKKATGEKRVHNRGLHYFAYMDADMDITAPSSRCSWTKYQNTEKCSDYMSEASEVARRLGLVPYDAISDEKNEVTKITRYYGGHITDVSIGSLDEPVYIPLKSSYEIDIDMPEDQYDVFETWRNKQADSLASSVKASISFDRKKLSPFHIEVWSEKNVPERVKRVIRNYADVLIEGEGHLSETVAHQFINRLNSRKKNGVALQLCDFDQAGLEMPISAARKVEKHKRDGKLKQEAYLVPIAITIDQIEEHDLPRKPIDVKKHPESRGHKAHKTLVNKFEKRMGRGATELQALEAQPKLYETIVENALKKWTIDPEKMNKDIQDIKKDAYNSVKKTVKDVLEDNRKRIEKFIEERRNFVEKLKDVLPNEEELKEINDKFKEARELIENDEPDDTLRSVADGLEVPEIEPPKYNNDPPVKPLLDTRREYGEQLAVYNEWNEFGKLETERS